MSVFAIKSTSLEYITANMSNIRDQPKNCGEVVGLRTALENETRSQEFSIVGRAWRCVNR